MKKKEHFQDDRGISGHGCIPLLGCIKNTSTDATVLTGYWLNTSRRTWSPERSIRIHDWVKQKKEREGARKEVEKKGEGGGKEAGLELHPGVEQLKQGRDFHT